MIINSNLSKNELHTFLLSNRNYCSERMFKKYFPNYYNEIAKISFPDNFSFPQKIYHYFNDDLELNLGFCDVCGKKCRFISFTFGYSKHCCIQCSNKCEELKKKRSIGYKKYYENETEENKQIRFKKQSLTIKETNSNKSDEIKQEECIKRGIGIHNSWINKPDDIKRLESIKKGNALHNSWLNKSDIEKEDIIKRRKDAQLNKFNGKWASQTNEFAKTRRKGILFNNIYFDSKWEIDVYCYCIENNLNFEYHPNISIEYTYDNKTHFYQPDFLINGKLYEVKGGQFFENGKMICPYNRNKYTDDKFEAKYQCMIQHNVIILSASKTRREFINNIKNIIK